MAQLKVFVSSTCYDLGPVRDRLRLFLTQLGHVPVMSEFSDVLYDPREHTHKACLQEIPYCDVVVLIVGARFGGTIVPEAVADLDIERLKGASKSNTILDSPEKLSITQAEVLAAVNGGLPIYTFIDEAVSCDHKTYQKNRRKPTVLAELEFGSIEKRETAAYIFEFINFLRHRSKGNSISTFSRFEDIEIHLKKQWSSYFQRLLSEQRLGDIQGRGVETISEQLESIKTALLATITDTGMQDAARGALRYRHLVDFFRPFGTESELAKAVVPTWKDLMSSSGITHLFERAPQGSSGPMGKQLVFLHSDGWASIGRNVSRGHVTRRYQELTEFSQLGHETRMAVVNAVSGEDRMMLRIQPRRSRIEEILDSKDSNPENWTELSLDGGMEVIDLDAIDSE